MNHILVQIEFTKFLTDKEAIQLFYRLCKYNYAHLNMYNLKGLYSYWNLIHRQRDIIPKVRRLFYDTFTEININHIMCSNLTQISFIAYFNQPVDNILPKTLTGLHFGIEFNQHVNYLPSSLQSLTFGVNFNQPVDHLPISLTNLEFGAHFNQPVNHLP